MENIVINSIDGYELSLNIYPIENQIGVVQIIHGMQEHQNRYITLANYLNSLGYSVVSSDIRGHGANANNLGYFAEKGGYKLVLEDQKVITEKVSIPEKAWYTILKVIMK